MNRQLVLLPLLAVSMVSANSTDEQKKTTEKFTNNLEDFRDTYGDSASLRACEKTWGRGGECDNFAYKEYKRWDRCEGRKKEGLRTRWLAAARINRVATRARENDPEKREEEMDSLKNEVEWEHRFLCSRIPDKKKELDSCASGNRDSCMGMIKDDCSVASHLLSLVARLNKLRKIEEKSSKN